MRRLMLIPLAALLVAIAPAAAATTKTVQITRTGFSPAKTTVTVGDTVTFHNADTQKHQVVANDGSFVSPVLSPDQTYSVTFSNAKTIHYHDGLNTKLKGTIDVKGPPSSVTLAAATQTVVYGSSTTLSGAVSSKQSSQPIVLLAQPAGTLKLVQASTTTTATDGAFSFGVTPTIQTVYQAQWKTATSPALTVYVAPRVGFGLSGRIYTAKVTSDLTYGGHFAYLQRRNSVGAWTSIKKVFLSSTSRARFTVKLVRGRSYLRMWLPASQAGSGYVQSISRTVAVVRR